MRHARVKIVVTGVEAVQRTIFKLAWHSVWFEVTPLPDDRWEIAVKPEAAGFLPNVVHI